MMTTLTCASSLLLVFAGASAGELSPGAPFDIAPFGFRTVDANDAACGIRWAEPRKVRRVVVEFEEGQVPSNPAAVTLQYWRRVWNGKADPLIVERGAGGVGWDAMDDWTNGRWIAARGRVERVEKGLEFTFAPTGQEEIPDMRGEGVSYRKTLAIRIRGDAGTPAVSRFRVYTDSVCRPLKVRIQLGPRGKAAATESGRLEVFNGQVTSIRASDGAAVTVAPDFTWTLAGSDPAILEADLVMAVDPFDGRYDRTIVTVRSDVRPFSFAADEAARGDRILVDDLGVLVTAGDDFIALDAYRDALRREFAGRTVYDRVAAEDEQTLARAWNDMPIKYPLYFVHGLPGNRNTMRQAPNGDVEVSAVRRWFQVQRSPRDSDRKLWKGDWLRISCGFPRDDRRGGRELLEGYLPVLRTWWQDGPLYYEQKTVLTAPLLNDITLNRPTVLLMQIRVANTSESQSADAALRFRSYAEGEERLVLRKNRVFAVTGEGQRLRFLISEKGPGDVVEDDGTLAWTANLKPGRSRTLWVTIPSITLLTEEEVEFAGRFDFDSETQRVCEFWRAITARGTQIVTPEPWINDFYKSHVRHLLVNCLRELDTDCLHAHVGTAYYGVYPNESVMMISDLDRRGYHDEARRNYDAFLRYQGSVSMPGNFGSAEGQFYGAGGHETGGYNKSHGYVMWGMAQHWQLTRDREWMAKAAPGLVKACEWVIRERRATMTANPDGNKPLEYGWLPAGSLEDVTDYWHWLATNSATVWGFRALADALADAGCEQGPRLQAEAQAYYDDFLRGVTESRILCPVVRLRDGTYVPKIPSRLYERGRAHGWLRETLEGPLFLPAYGLLSPEAPETTWIMKDYEDNLYISDRYGYSIPAYDAFWFSRGGFSMQANLLDGPLPYLWRDDVKHYIRAYFNGFASAFYPEIRMCNEHSLPELGYPRGDHFKTSDEAQSTYWLRLMFVNERGGDLYLGQAIPRYWLADGNRIGIERAASDFGPMSLRYESRTAAGEVKITLEPPARNPPANIYLRVRHPQGRPIRSALVNGKAWDRIDPRKEWVVLPGALDGRQEVLVRYQ